MYDSNYKLSECLEIDSVLVFLFHSDISSNVYVYLYKDDKIIRFRYHILTISKISEKKISVLHGGYWSLNADFRLLLIPEKLL